MNINNLSLYLNKVEGPKALVSGQVTKTELF